MVDRIGFNLPYQEYYKEIAFKLTFGADTLSSPIKWLLRLLLDEDSVFKMHVILSLHNRRKKDVFWKS